MNALEQINNDRSLAWLSETARAILAVALHRGTPLDMDAQDDATRCVVAEHLVRREGHSIGEALSLARSDVSDAHLRGIVRFASSLGERSEYTELDRILDGDPVRIMPRGESIETALFLFALATVDAVPSPPPVLPRELVHTEEQRGSLVGRCTGCGGPTYIGSCTIAIGWPKTKPRWETITPSAINDARTDPSKPPARGSKLRMLSDGDLPVLCTTCTMRMRHAGWVPPEPTTSTIETDEGHLEPTAVDTTVAALDTVQHIRLTTVSEKSNTATVGEVTVAGLIPRATAIADASAALKVDQHRIDRLRDVVKLEGDDAELRYRILAAAWAAGRPLRITTRPDDRLLLDAAIDVALRGGNPLRRIGVA